MKSFAKLLFTLMVCSAPAALVAQAPIVRQTPGVPGDPGIAASAPYVAPAYDSQTQPYPAAMAYPTAAQAVAPPLLAPQQLDRLVGRIALFPDPLLAQVLTASTFWNEIPDAARWAYGHSYLVGDALNEAIQADALPWDPSVLALLPFPSVLDMMARDPAWTSQLGYAVLDQRPDVMDAVQRLRVQARSYGYLAKNGYVDVIDNNGIVEIQPLTPYSYYVPVYDPLVVFRAPLPGVVIGGVIHFGAPVTIGGGFVTRFGWFGAGFAWGTHDILIDHRPWGRTFANRAYYVHSFGHGYVHPVVPRREGHDMHRR